MPAKQSIEMLKASGKSHLTKAEIEEREATELKVDLLNIRVPSYLPKRLIPKYEELANKLKHVKIMTELDEDALARYVVSESNYEKYSIILDRLLRKRDQDIVLIEKYANLQDKSFKQSRSIANDLGLSIVSRVKIVAPPKKEEEKEKKKSNKFAKFEKDLSE